jgi:hypothetical protein
MVFDLALSQDEGLADEAIFIHFASELETMDVNK